MDKLINDFIVIVPTYNAGKLIESCLLSILTQRYNDLGVIIRDDVSSDDTPKIIESIIGINGKDETYIKFNGKDVIYIQNTEKLYPVGNTYESVINYVGNPEAIIGVVDGDDSLMKGTAIKKVKEAYDKSDAWLVWSKHTPSSGKIGLSKELPSDDFIYSGRDYWSVTHFRTSKAWLFNKLNKEDLLDPFVVGSYYQFCGDAAFLYPFCEMCGNEKTYFINESLYLYNDNLPLNEHNKNTNMAVKYGSHIRNNGKRYKQISGK